MELISFSQRPEEIWIVRSWCFHQILSDVASQYPDDTEMLEAFDYSEAVGALQLDFLDRALASRIAERLQKVATSILSGTVPSGIYNQRYFNEETLQQYHLGLRMLLESIPKASLL